MIVKLVLAGFLLAPAGIHASFVPAGRRRRPEEGERRVATTSEPGVGWQSLGIAARVFRLAHVGWGLVNLGALAYVWICAAVRRRDRPLAASVGLLAAEGVALLVGRGNCPFGPFQRRLGDPVPMFELVLSPRAAKAAIPVLTVVTLAGFAALVARGPLQVFDDEVHGRGAGPAGLRRKASNSAASRIEPVRAGQPSDAKRVSGT